MFVGEPECLRASLSCGRTEEFVLKLRKAIPRLRPMRPAVAELDVGHGVIQKTRGPGHYSVWLTRAALGAAPGLFRVIP